MTGPRPYGDYEPDPGTPTPPGGWSSVTGGPTAEAVVRGRPGRLARTERDLDAASELDEYNARLDEIKLRRGYGKALLIVLCVQLGLVDLALVAYGVATQGNFDATVLQVFIGGTVVEVVGLVWVVVKYLFSPETAPRRRGGAHS